jgi:hypothetical protein
MVVSRFHAEALHKPLPKPRSQWIVAPGAFPPLVKPETYAKVQRIIARTTKALPHNRSDQELIDDLREILRKHRKITMDLINASSKATSPRTYTLDSERRAALTGWQATVSGVLAGNPGRIQQLRNELMKSIVVCDPARGAGNSLLEPPSDRGWDTCLSNSVPTVSWLRRGYTVDCVSSCGRIVPHNGRREAQPWMQRVQRYVRYPTGWRGGCGVLERPRSALGTCLRG